MSVAARASVLQGLQVMSVNPLRTSLSTLGVVIGVASVISTLALTDGLERYARDEIETQTDVQAVTINSRTHEVRDGFSHPMKGYPIFTAADAIELQDRLGSKHKVTMMTSGQAIITSSTASPHVATVTAVLANFLAFGQKDVFAGRFFTDGEAARNAPVVVLSHKLAEELAPDGNPEHMIGRELRVHGRPVTALGVMPSYLGELGYQVFIPLRAAGAAFGGGGEVTPSLLVHAPSLEVVEAAKAEVVEWIATRYRDWSKRVTITTQAARLAQAKSGMLAIKLLFAALAGISLIVGGVGIMNVLLASVAERTREIGVRKALGARQRDILYQFLAESVAIASVGSGVGTAFGLLTAFAVAAGIRWRIPGAKLHAAVTAPTLLTAVLSAAVIGLTFGTFPALRAARLSPIDAIRHD
jgi:putative ABC transport system permease protein